MKLLIEINTSDEQTLDEALALVSLYKLKYSQAGTPVTEKPKEPETEKPKAQRIRPKKEPVEETTETNVEPSSEAVEEETRAETTVTLNELKKAAKEASDTVGREKVLKTISRYGAKLSDVTENNYEALHSELVALVK